MFRNCLYASSLGTASTAPDLSGIQCTSTKQKPFLELSSNKCLWLGKYIYITYSLVKTYQTIAVPLEFLQCITSSVLHICDYSKWEQPREAKTKGILGEGKKLFGSLCLPFLIFSFIYLSKVLIAVVPECLPFLMHYPHNILPLGKGIHTL